MGEVKTLYAIIHMLTKIKAAQPNAKIIVNSVLPRGVNGADAVRQRNGILNYDLQKWVQTKGAGYVWCDLTDLFVDKANNDALKTQYFASDKVTLNADGYTVWANAIKDYVAAAVDGTTMPEALVCERRPLQGSVVNAAYATSRTYPGLGYWEKICNFLYGNGVKSDADVVLLGDSITERWAGTDVGSMNGLGTNVMNLGNCGDTTENLLWRLENGELDGYKAKWFNILIGVNNNLEKNPADGYADIAAGVGRIVELVKTKHPESRITLMPILPYGYTNSQHNAEGEAIYHNNEQANMIISSYADNQRVFLVDVRSQFFNADGTFNEKMYVPMNGSYSGSVSKDYADMFLHLSDKAYKDVIAPALTSKMASAGNSSVVLPTLGSATAQISGANVTITVADIAKGTDASGAAAGSYSLIYKLDAAAEATAAGSAATSVALTELADGPHTCAVWVRNSAGFESEVKRVAFKVNSHENDVGWSIAPMDDSGTGFRSAGTAVFASGYANSDQTVNGVQFKCSQWIPGEDKVTFTPAVDSANGGGWTANNPVFIGGWTWSKSGGATLDITGNFKGLTAGHKYLVQILTHYYWFDSSKVTSVSAGGLAPVTVSESSDYKYGAIVSRVFIASGATEDVTVTFSGANTKCLIKAIQLRDLGAAEGGDEPEVVNPSIGSATTSVNGSAVSFFLSGVVMGTDDAGSDATSYSVSYQLGSAAAVTALTGQSGSSANFTVNDLADGSYSGTVTVTTDKNKTASKSVSFTVNTYVPPVDPGQDDPGETPVWPNVAPCQPCNRCTIGDPIPVVAQLYQEDYNTLHSGTLPKTFDLVTVGDSITCNWSVRDSSGYYALSPNGLNGVFNLGIGGDRTQHVIWRLEQGGCLENFTTKYFTVMIGVNNSFQPSESNDPLDDPAEIAKGVERIVYDLKTVHPESKILLMPIIPYERLHDARGPAVHANDEAVNDIIINLVDNKRVFWVDLRGGFLNTDGTLNDDYYSASGADGSDGAGHYLHPASRGYQEVFNPAVAAAMAKYDAIPAGTAQETDPSLGYALASIDGAASKVTMKLVGVYLGTDTSAHAATSYSVSYKLDDGAWTTALENQTLTRNSFDIPDVAVGEHTCQVKVTANTGKTVTVTSTFTMCDAWSAVHLTSDSSCVSTNGTLVYAYAQSACTPNGVSFARLESTDNTDVTWGITYGYTSSHTAPAGITDSGYSTLLSKGWWIPGGTGGSRISMTLKNLTAGDKYLVQIFAYRSAYNEGTLWIDGTQKDTTFIKAGSGDWTCGGMLAGVFTADAATKTFDIMAEGQTALNGFQVRRLGADEHYDPVDPVTPPTPSYRLNVPARTGLVLVSVTTNGQAVSAMDGTYPILEGSTVKVTFAADDGYEIVGSDYVTFTMTGEKTLTEYPVVQSTAVADPVTLTKVAEYSFGVNGCGGITYSGTNNVFYVLRDHGEDNRAKVYPLTLGINLETAAITSQTLGDAFTPGSNSDSEGIAWDRKSKKVWISDETIPSIAEFDLDGVASGRTVTVPDIQKTQKRSNKSLEALTISPDGLTMWSANEQALSCDGGTSDGNTTVQTVVRLMKFTRSTLTSAWMAAGEFAYACDTCAATYSAESGLSGLCALADGSLLALEREVSIMTWGRCRIYRITPSAIAAATDVTSISALDGATYAPVAKGEPLVSFNGGNMSTMIVYEGITLGPKLNDGSRSVYLVSDGGATKGPATTVSRLCALKLSGIVEPAIPDIPDDPVDPVDPVATGWTSSPMSASGDTIRTDGTLVYAYARRAATVNTVPFQGLGDVNLGDVYSHINFTFDVDMYRDMNADVEDPYQNLINHRWNSGSTGSRTLTLKGLTSGKQYLVQLIMNFQESYGAGAKATVEGVTAMANGTGWEHGGSLVGVFTASGTTEAITINYEVYTVISAIQVRELDGTTPIDPPVDPVDPPVDPVDPPVAAGWTAEPLGATEASICTNGTLLYAYARRDNTVNTVPFTGLGDVNLNDVYSRINFTYDVDMYRDMNADQTDPYQNLLAHRWTSGSTGDRTLTLKGLTAGKNYLVQLIICFPDSYAAGTKATIEGVTVKANGTDWENGGSLIGVFTATGDTQTFTINYERYVSINAIQVREVTAAEPEGPDAPVIGGEGVDNPIVFGAENVTITIGNADGVHTYGYKKATTIEGLATAEEVYPKGLVAAGGILSIDIPRSNDESSCFYQIVVK